MPEDASKPDPADLPKGLVLFQPDSDPARRRRRQIFLVIYVLVAAALVWPIYPRMGGIEPMILGLPLSLAWVIFVLSVMFGALLWMFRNDES